MFNDMDEFFDRLDDMGEVVERDMALYIYRQRSMFGFDITVTGGEEADRETYGMLYQMYSWYDGIVTVCCDPFLRAALEGVEDVATYTLGLWQERGFDSPAAWVSEQAAALMPVSASMAALKAIRDASGFPLRYSDEPGYRQVAAVLAGRRYGFMAHRFVAVTAQAYEADPDMALSFMGDMDREQLAVVVAWIDAILAAYGDLLWMIGRQQEMAS